VVPRPTTLICHRSHSHYKYQEHLLVSKAAERLVTFGAMALVAAAISAVAFSEIDLVSEVSQAVFQEVFQEAFQEAFPVALVLSAVASVDLLVLVFDHSKMFSQNICI
jgi:hypothetical protein